MPACAWPFAINVEDPLYKGVSYKRLLRTVKVPCGKCPNCLKAKQQSVQLRLYFEGLSSPSSVFATLTYANEHLPYVASKLTGELLPSLCYNDIQLWLKRCRIRFFRSTGRRVRFFVCGEYGPNTHRPHYHVIIFGLQNYEFVRYFGSDWSSNYGYVVSRDIDITNDGAFCYVGKYSSKGVLFSSPQVNSKEVARPFRYGSKNLGVDYLSANNNANYNYHTCNDLFPGYFVHIRQNDGKVRLPFTTDAQELRAFFKVNSTLARFIRAVIHRLSIRVNGYIYGLPTYYYNKIFGSTSENLSLYRFRALITACREYESSLCASMPVPKRQVAFEYIAKVAAYEEFSKLQRARASSARYYKSLRDFYSKSVF